MTDRPLRAGLAACGGIADLTLDAAKISSDFDIVAIQDPNPEALARVGERSGGAKRHTDFEDLLADDVDFVILNSPNHLHLPQVRAAAAAGKHCLVQKPMATTVAEAEEMIEVAAAAGVKLGVTMFELSKPVNRQAREMVASGWMGDPILVQATCAHGIYLRDPLPDSDWRMDPEKVGGGAFIQLALHQVDLSTFLLDRDAVEAGALTARGKTAFADETTLATIRFAGGILGHFAASYATDLWRLTICGTRGRIRLSGDNVLVYGEKPFIGEVFDYDQPGREFLIPHDSLRFATDRVKHRYEVHAAFARWVRDDEPYVATGERGLADMKVVDAVHRSVEEGKCVTVS
ncbi:MAG: Gfo/Idh/MocA family oxidoreductase [Planctomycetota bacterium]